MIRQRRWVVILWAWCALVCRWAVADAYDPPAGYYSTATGTGAALKSQLHNIIDDHDSRSYDQLRSDLQVTDVDPNNASRIVLVYNNRQSVAKPTGGSIPGWDGGVTWNREHSWPQARGVENDSSPDGSDMHHVFPSDPDENNRRANLNFGGVFGAQSFGIVSDGGTKYYPGDLDAGLIARAQFYMAVRYDGSDGNTQNLELSTGNPGSGGTTLGDLTRLLEWHFAAPPDEFERRRNQVIYDNFQHNRNPFIDRPEFAWSVFMNNTNDSRITIAGVGVDANGGSTRNVDLGRVFVGGTVPGAQAFSLNKSGNDGTYYEVTTSGEATSSVVGRYNAFRTGTTGAKTIDVGLNTNTTLAGLRSGTVTVNNLDVTTGGGAGRGANDADDTFQVSLAVLDHARPSFADGTIVTTLAHDFGSIALGSEAPEFSFELFNLTGTPGYTASLEFDGVVGSGDTGMLTTDLAGWAGTLTLGAGLSQVLTATLDTSAVGNFAATYELSVSDEDLPGALSQVLTLTLSGEVTAVLLSGDFNGDGWVDAADYAQWRAEYGMSVTPFSGADGDGNGIVDDADYALWTAHFGQGSPAAGSNAMAAVPEPTSAVSLATLALGWQAAGGRRRRRRCR